MTKQRSRVALVRGTTRYQTIAIGLDSISSEVHWPDKGYVLIKPNFVSTTRPLAATHVDAVRAILDFVRAHTDLPIVIAEGAALSNTWEGFANFGYLPLPDEYVNVSLQDLNADIPVSVQVYDRNFRPQTLHLARTVVEADLRISVGPPKTHDTVIVTLSLKNMVMGSLINRRAAELPYSTTARGGIARENPLTAKANLNLAIRELYGRLPGRIKQLSVLESLRSCYMTMVGNSDKARMHQGYPAINLNLFLLAHDVYPHLSVIDGWEAMEGDGPVDGAPVDWRVAIVSADFLAADALTVDLMSFRLHEIGYLHYCYQAGMGAGSLDEMDIVGNLKPDHARRRFRRPSTYRGQRQWALPPQAARLLEDHVKQPD